MINNIDIKSLAKVNLMLRVLGQRPDGYHLLQTYFQLLNWGDDMSFASCLQDDIIIEGNFNNVAQEDNLIYHAILLLKPHRKKKCGLHITVNKRIPQGSGLGGGSSNAGNTLKIVNQMWQCQLKQSELQKMALQLGADVPIFVANQSSMASGVGEQLTPYALKKIHFALIFPPVSISTADVFSDNLLFRNDQKIRLNRIKDKKFWTNTCLSVVLNNYPEVAEIYHKASQLAPTYLSGTGSTLFCCFESQTQAQQFQDRCPKHWQIQLCESEIN